MDHIAPGVHVTNPVDPEHPTTSIGHAPITTTRLRPCLVEVTGHEDRPLDEEAYQLWQEGGRGVFTISVAEIVDTVERTLLQGTVG